MRDIAALVFGGEPHEEQDHHERPDYDEELCGGHAAPAGDWCQTPPGRSALSWLGVTHRDAGCGRDRSRRAPFGMRIF